MAAPQSLKVAAASMPELTALRLRLARYFNSYPLHHDIIPVGITAWAIERLVYGQEPEPYDIEVVAHCKHDYHSMPLTTTAYCVECDLVYHNLPVSIPNSIVHSCANCCRSNLTWHNINYRTYNILHNVVV